MSHGDRPWNLQFHSDSNTTERDKDSWEFASPENTGQVPIAPCTGFCLLCNPCLLDKIIINKLMLQHGGLLPQMTPGHQVPNGIT